MRPRRLHRHRTRLQNYRSWVRETCVVEEVTQKLDYSLSPRDRAVKKLFEASRDEGAQKVAASTPCRPEGLFAPSRAALEAAGTWHDFGGMLSPAAGEEQVGSVVFADLFGTCF